MTPELLTLLAGVIADPADDTVRLAFADRLDEEAEERHEATPCRKSDFIRRQIAGDALTIPLTMLVEMERFVGVQPHQTQRSADRVECEVYVGGQKRLVYRRGFVEEVRTPWADWSRHADALYWRPAQDRPCPPTACPLRKVVLTTWPTGNPTREDSLARFAAAWPGVEFELPARFGDIVNAAARSYTYDPAAEYAARMATASAAVAERFVRDLMAEFAFTEDDVRAGRVAMSRVQLQDPMRPPTVVQCDCEVQNFALSRFDRPSVADAVFHTIQLRDRRYAQRVDFGRTARELYTFRCRDGRCPRCGTVYYAVTPEGTR